MPDDERQDHARQDDARPGDDASVFRWLGRQVGHVRHALGPAKATPLYRQARVDEMPHPDLPGVKLRRTTVDEAFAHSDKPAGEDP